MALSYGGSASSPLASAGTIGGGSTYAETMTTSLAASVKERAN